MQKMKRWLASVLSVLMLVSALPVTAVAESASWTDMVTYNLLDCPIRIGSDALALQLGIDNASRLVKETLLRLDANQIDAKLAFEDLLDLLALVEAHAAVVDEDARELLADGLMQKHGAHGAVNPA